MQDTISGLFWFAFPWWLMMLNISFKASWSFKILQWRIISLEFCPIFNWIIWVFYVRQYIWTYLQFSTCRQPVMPAPYVEDALFFPLYIFGFFVKKSGVHWSVDLHLGLWFDSLDKPVWFYDNTMLFLFLFVFDFFHHSSTVVLEIRDGDNSGSSFIVQDCFVYPELSVFPYEFDYCSFKYVKNCVETLMGIALNL